MSTSTVTVLNAVDTLKARIDFICHEFTVATDEDAEQNASVEDIFYRIHHKHPKHDPALYFDFLVKITGA